MGLPWSLIITTAGAVLTTLLGVLVGGAVSNRSQQRSWSRDRQADACAQVLRESSNVLIELAAMSAQRVKPARTQSADPLCLPTPIDWKPWNEALAMVNLVADHEIADAAHAIDAEIWPVHLKIKRGLASDGDWYVLRDKVEVRRQDFVNVARKRLSSSGPPLPSLTGRPAPDNPMWAFPQADLAEVANITGDIADDIAINSAE